jgi:predicted Zn-dependent protease
MQTSSPLRRPWPGILAALLTLGTTAAAGDIELPDIGDSSRGVLSEQRERAIGEAFVRALRRSATVVEEADVQEYVQGLGQRVTAHADSTDQRFRFFVVQDPRINAFAAPGGYIALHSGLILATESESELAAVLAHEVAHVTQGHIARRFEVADRMTIPMIAALAASALVATQSPQAGAAALVATQAGAMQLQLDFTRANELEADRLGIATLASADFDPKSMPAFFERLQQSMRYYGRPPEFLSTHPVTETRIAEGWTRAEQFPQHSHKDSSTFHLVRAKLRVLTARDPVEVLRDFDRVLASGQYPSRESVRYGRALALKRTGKVPEALAELRALHQAASHDVALLAERARLEHEAGNTPRALELFAEGLALYPDHPILAPGYAETLLQAGRAQKARDVLVAYGRAHDPTPGYYRMLARSQELSDNLLEAHLAMAEYQYLMGQTAQAVEQLERARKRAGDDFYAVSRIDARLLELKRELAEAKARR